jgi:hypothetical protein
MPADLLAHRALDPVAFIPAAVTLVVQVAGFLVTARLVDNAEGKLNAAGLSPQHLATASEVMQSLALVAQVLTGFVATIVVLQLTGVATKSPEPGADWILAAVTILSYVVVVVTVLWSEGLFDEINDHPGVQLPVLDRVMLLIRMRSYGLLLTWVVILLTLLLQVLTAYLSLPAT